MPRALDGERIGELARGFAEADRTPRPRSLALRCAEYLEREASPSSEAASFEAWLRQPPGTDLEAERFGAIPEDPDVSEGPEGPEGPDVSA